jgi:hypothetical protein
MSQYLNYPVITIGDLKQYLAAYPDNYEIDFCGLTFNRLKQRGEKSVQIEFTQELYRTPEGTLIARDIT